MSDSNVFNCEKEGGFPLYLFALRRVVLCSKVADSEHYFHFDLNALKLYHSRYFSKERDPLSLRRNAEVNKNIARAFLAPLGMVMYYRVDETHKPMGVFFAKDCKIECVGGNYARVHEPLRAHLFRFSTTDERNSFCNSLKFLKGVSQNDILEQTNFREIELELEAMPSAEKIWDVFSRLYINADENSDLTEKEEPEHLDTNSMETSTLKGKLVETLHVPAIFNQTVPSDEGIDMGSPRVIDSEAPEEQDNETVVVEDKIEKVAVVDGNLKIKVKKVASMKNIKRIFSKRKPNPNK